MDAQHVTAQPNVIKLGKDIQQTLMLDPWEPHVRDKKLSQTDARFDQCLFWLSFLLKLRLRL